MAPTGRAGEFALMSERELLYGRNAVRETLRAGRRQAHRLHLMRDAKASPAISEILELAADRNVPVEWADRRALDGMAGGARHQGVVLEAASYPYVSLPDLIEGLGRGPAGPLVLALDYVQDPQNLGTLIRTAEALALDGIVIPERRAAGVTPAVVNSSSGACEHLAIARATNLPRALRELQAAGLWLAGLEQVEGARRHVDADLTGPLGLVIGSEGSGMSRLAREACDYFIQLPMFGRVNSLNAAVAGSVALYEIWRQRAAQAGRAG